MLGASFVAAQAEEGSPSADAPTGDGVVDVQARREASVAYERATALYAANDFARAGRFFMTAYRLAPARAALLQAVRAYTRAGDVVRAGNLGLALKARYGAHEASAADADAAIQSAAATHFRVNVACEGCEVSVGPAIYPTTSVFLEPDNPHQLVAHFGEAGRVERTVSGAAGTSQDLALETPVVRVEPDPVEAPDPVAEPAEPAEPVRVEGGGLPRGVFFTALGATAVMGGVTLWSGLDTLAGVDDYEAMPTQEAYDEGQQKERRTNALIGVTSGLAVATVLIAVFTRWGGGDDLAVGASATAEGGMVTIGGRL